MFARFKVVNIDPNGSGYEWSGHLGKVIDAQRCCKNCVSLLGWTIEEEKINPIYPLLLSELEPLNEEAKLLVSEITKFEEEQNNRKHREVIKSERFNKSWEQIKEEFAIHKLVERYPFLMKYYEKIFRAN